MQAIPKLCSTNPSHSQQSHPQSCAPNAPEVLFSQNACHLNGHASSKRSISLSITTILLLLLLLGCLGCCQLLFEAG
jgi:hypothetical protein